jgi:leader peptidase (prepilin peptidase)/N-methyltransferase
MSPEQKLVLLIFAGVFGLLVGSFLNVCIFRLPRECMSIVRPRSRCNSCRNFIAWYDNIPVVSWLILRGRCRKCGVKISPRYAAVELLTGAIFAWAAYVQLCHGTFPDGTPLSGRQGAAWFAVQTYLASALIVCTFIDLEFTILPDEITLSGTVLGLIAGAAFPFIYEMTGEAPWFQPGHFAWLPAAFRGPFTGLAHAAAGAAAGGLIIYAIGVLGKLAFRKEAMGFGDVKLMAFLGAFLGPKAVLMALFVAVFLGAFFGIGKYVVLRRMGYVPFGPFLSAGALVMVFASGPVWRGFDAYLTLLRGPR